MKLFICDCETTGLDPKKDSVVEFAWAVLNVATKRVIACSSFTIPHDEIPTSDLIRLTPEDTKTLSGQISASGVTAVGGVAEECDAIVAHNAKFDKAFVEESPIWYGFPKKLKWVCSYEDLDFGTKATKLSYMCCDHGVPVAGAHAAIFDVLMLAQLLAKLPNLEESVNKALSGTKYLVTANVSYDNRQSAKDAGFQWNAEEKKWQKRVIAEGVDEVKKMFDFLVMVKEIS